MQYHESKRFFCSCERIFSVVADIERYPEFLPGWSQARILRCGEAWLEVEQQLQLALFRIRFRSRARLVPCRRIVITGEEAPFGAISIEWEFAPRAGGSHCDVSLRIELALRPGPLKPPLQRFLRHAGGALLQRFEERVRELSGTADPS